MCKNFRALNFIDIPSDGQRYPCYQFTNYFRRNRVLVVPNFLPDPILRMRLKNLVNQNREFVRISLFLLSYLGIIEILI